MVNQAAFGLQLSIALNTMAREEQPMSQIVVDEALRARLNGLGEELTFCDESGTILGHFIPVANGKKNRTLMLPQDQCPYTPEELERMRNETGGRPLHEIWKSLGVK